MWLSDRRTLILSALALGACGFQPAFGPGGSGAALLDRVRLAEPTTSEAYLFNRRFEERLGRGDVYDLQTDLSVSLEELGSTSAGATTRFRILGTATYRLTSPGSDTPLLGGKTQAFTGYSTTGSTVATLAAERDASERLMTLLADQVIDNLLVSADQLPDA